MQLQRKRQPGSQTEKAGPQVVEGAAHPQIGLAEYRRDHPEAQENEQQQLGIGGGSAPLCRQIDHKCQPHINQCIAHIEQQLWLDGEPLIQTLDEEPSAPGHVVPGLALQNVPQAGEPFAGAVTEGEGEVIGHKGGQTVEEQHHRRSRGHQQPEEGSAGGRKGKTGSTQKSPPFRFAKTTEQTHRSAHADLAFGQNIELALLPALAGQTDGQRDRAHTTDEHGDHGDDQRKGMHLTGHAHRAAHRAEGADHLIQAVQRADDLAAVEKDHQSNKNDHTQAQHGDAQRLVNGFLVNAAAEDLGVLPAGDHAGHRDQNYAEGGHLNATAGAAGGCTDEHEHAEHALGDGTHGGQINRVKARGSGADGLEHAVHDLVACSHAAQGGRVVPFQEGKAHGAAHDQQDGAEQNHLGVDGQMVGFAPLAQVVPDQKAQAAGNNQEHDNALYIPVGGVAHQAHIALGAAQNVETGVAEGGDGQKDRDKDAFGPVLRNKDGQQQQKAKTFKEGGQFHDHQQKPPGLRHVGGADGFAGELHGAEAHPPAQSQREEAGQRNKAQAADLDQTDHHRLAKQGEALVGVQHNKAGYAGGTGGGEESLHRRDAVTGGEGKHEQQRTGHNNHQKAGNDQTGGGKALQPAAFFGGRSGPADQPAQLRCLKGTGILFHVGFPPHKQTAPLSGRTNAILLCSYNIHVCRRYFNLILPIRPDIITKYAQP